MSLPQYYSSVEAISDFLLPQAAERLQGKVRHWRNGRIYWGTFSQGAANDSSRYFLCGTNVTTGFDEQLLFATVPLREHYAHKDEEMISLHPMKFQESTFYLAKTNARPSYSTFPFPAKGNRVPDDPAMENPEKLLLRYLQQQVLAYWRPDEVSNTSSYAPESIMQQFAVANEQRHETNPNMSLISLERLL